MIAVLLKLFDRFILAIFRRGKPDLGRGRTFVFTHLVGPASGGSIGSSQNRGRGQVNFSSKAGASIARDSRGEASASTPAGRLLIVDDLPDNRAVLTRRFVKRGFEIVEAESGEQALKLIREQTFDCVLLDVMMPGMDGTQVLRHIREKLSASVLPVIMVTAKSQSEDVVDALQLGANDYLTKPVDFAIALARVNSQIGWRRAALEIRQANPSRSTPSSRRRYLVRSSGFFSVR